MKKSLLIVALLATSFGAANAQNVPPTTLANQIVISPTKTINLATAKVINFQPGQQSVIDGNGITHPATFSSEYQVKYAEAFRSYVQVGTSATFVNLAKVTTVECVNNTSVVAYEGTAPSSVADGCAFADKVKAYSRR